MPGTLDTNTKPRNRNRISNLQEGVHVLLHVVVDKGPLHVVLVVGQDLRVDGLEVCQSNATSEYRSQ